MRKKILIVDDETDLGYLLTEVLKRRDYEPVYVENGEQKTLAEASRDAYQDRLRQAGFGPITTEILPESEFYYAEDYHQQYLAKNPEGYCGLGGTGVACPTGVPGA